MLGRRFIGPKSHQLHARHVSHSDVGFNGAKRYGPSDLMVCGYPIRGRPGSDGSFLSRRFPNLFTDGDDDEHVVCVRLGWMYLRR